MRRNRVVLICCFRLIAVVAAAALSVAGCNGRQQTLPNTDLSAAKEMGLVRSGVGIATSADTWTTFAYDYQRTGYDPYATSITKSNVSKLTLRWEQSLGYDIFASPVAYAGNLIVVTLGGPVKPGVSTVYDFATSNGKQLWKFSMGANSEGQMTPTIDPNAGLVIVAGEFRISSQKFSEVFALRLLDGSLVWQRQLPGLVRSAPVVAGGRVYVGLAGGDPHGYLPHCLQGGITALDESTGAVDWNWYVDSTPNEGGSVWGAIAYDGAHLIFGTGNTCQQPVPTANGAVELSPTGKLLWSMIAVKDSYYDSDTGSGVTLFGGLAHFINKNGEFYAIHQLTGKVAWTTDLNPYASPTNASGGFTTAATDGTTIVEGSGSYKDSGPQVGGEFCILAGMKPTEVTKGYHSQLQGMNMQGHVLWSLSMTNRLVGYVALAQGMGFVGLNQDFVALDLTSGKTLWSYPTPAYINPSMIVVPSGLYGADDAGNVYAFAVPTKR